MKLKQKSLIMHKLMPKGFKIIKICLFEQYIWNSKGIKVVLGLVSQDVAPESDTCIMPCINIDKPQVVYILITLCNEGHNDVAYDKLLAFHAKKCDFKVV